MELFPIQSIKEVKKGDFLISEPFLPDSNFSRSVILICDDAKDTHIGFVINKTLETHHLGQLVDQLEKSKKEILVGGPVQRNVIQVLHKNPAITDSMLVSDGIYWGGDFDEIRSQILNGKMKEDDCWFFLGYSGWYKGQLTKELKEQSWLVLKHDIPTVLGLKKELVWKKCISLLGRKFDIITNFPSDPTLN
jgi:putative transcriptional regulator